MMSLPTDFTAPLATMYDVDSPAPRGAYGLREAGRTKRRMMDSKIATPGPDYFDKVYRDLDWRFLFCDAGILVRRYRVGEESRECQDRDRNAEIEITFLLLCPILLFHRFSPRWLLAICDCLLISDGRNCREVFRISLLPITRIGTD